MQTRYRFGLSFSIPLVFLVVTLQAKILGAFVGYLAMQYFKNPDHKPTEGFG